MLSGCGKKREGEPADAPRVKKEIKAWDLRVVGAPPVIPCDVGAMKWAGGQGGIKAVEEAGGGGRMVSEGLRSRSRHRHRQCRIGLPMTTTITITTTSGGGGEGGILSGWGALGVVGGS
jgi:hypothetical protein